MKKILIFSLAYYPHHVSGAEAAVKEITDRISSIEFHMVTLSWGNDMKMEKIGNVVVHRVGAGGSYLSKIFFPLIAANKALDLQRENHFDLMWAMMTYMLLPVTLAKFLGVRIPHLLSLQDGDPYEKVFSRARILPFLPLIDHGFKSAIRIQAISSYLAGWPEKRGYTKETIIIHNGANPRDFEPVSEQKVEALKNKLGKKEGDIFLVNTARLEKQKGNDVTIHALATLPENIKLLLVGGGSDEKFLKQLASKLGLVGRVLFVGSVPREEVTLYRRISDIFVGPSRSEGLGNAFLSAMASGLPVVATQEGGLSEFIRGKVSPETQTAWSVKSDSPDEIVNAVTYILEHPDEVKVVTARAQTMVQRAYRWEMIAKDMETNFFAPALDQALILKARNFATHAHRTQKRKTDGSPYIGHPKAVAEMVMQEGRAASVVAAAWLHDVVEDTGTSITAIEERFGIEVKGLVQAVTEDKNLEWRKRKEAYVQAVKNASEDARIISLADKVHNMRWLLDAYQKQGKAVWQIFTRGKEEKLWFEEEMLKIFQDTLKTPLVEEYRLLIEKMRSLV